MTNETQSPRAGDGETLGYSVDAEDGEEMDRQLEEAWSENEALKDELATLQRDYARALDSIKGHIAWTKAQEQHIRELRAFQAMVNRHAPEFPADPEGIRDVWYWQGDGRDHLESMTHQLPVVIRAEQLRELLAAAPAAAPVEVRSQRADPPTACPPLGASVGPAGTRLDGQALPGGRLTHCGRCQKPKDFACRHGLCKP